MSAFSKEAIKDWAEKHLAPKSKVVSDGLECFTAFQKSGHEHIAIITGGGPQSVEMPEFKWVNTIISNHVRKKTVNRLIAEFVNVGKGRSEVER